MPAVRKPAASPAVTAFRAVARSPLYLQIAEQMRAAILGGTLGAGQTLPSERALCTQFSASRASVREALRVLQAEGLLEGRERSSPQRTTVSEPSHDALSLAFSQTVIRNGIRLQDLIELRCALESSCLERAAARPLREPMRRAEEALRAMQQPGISIEAFCDADVRFHVELSAASGNEAVRALLGAVREATREHLADALQRAPRPRAVLRTLCDEHQAIFDAVLAGDGALAARRVREHIESFYRRARRWRPSP